MPTMLSQHSIYFIFNWIGLNVIKNRIGLDGAFGPIGTGRKGLKGYTHQLVGRLKYSSITQ